MDSDAMADPVMSKWMMAGSVLQKLRWPVTPVEIGTAVAR